MRLRTKPKINNKIVKNKKHIVKPQQQRTLALTTQANLIITYSENRKDTLRSSTKAKSTTTTTTPEFKQQTLLDMFQQRKRRNNENIKSNACHEQHEEEDQQNKIRKYFQQTAAV